MNRNSGVKTKFPTTALPIIIGSAILLAGIVSWLLLINLREPFKVMVTPEKIHVHVGKKFTLHLKVENVSNVNQHIDTWTCDWLGNWKCDNPAVRVNFGGCDVNVPGHFELKPGESWEEKWEWFTIESASTNKILFHMIFNPVNSVPDPFPDSQKFAKAKKGRYLSNEVTIDLLPN